MLTIEVDGSVATPVARQPAARNAMGQAFWTDLPLVVEELGADDGVRAIVLAAKGKDFTAGIDLNMFASVVAGNDEGSAVSRRRAFLDEVKRLQASITAVADCPKPVIAAVHACIGGAWT